jgi:regulator of RNase E activity RraA
MAKPTQSPDVLAALRKFDSPTISNAIEHFRVRDPVDGYASLELLCQFPQYAAMVGYAVTCTADSATPGDRRHSRLANLLEAIQTASKPAVLVIQNVGPDRRRSCFVGDMFCSALQKMGVVGVVTDGGCRDRAGIARRTPGFQLFAAGAVVSHGHGVIVEVDVTVSVCGLTVQSGDLLHGDASGLLVIPHEIAAAVPQQAEAVRQAEAGYFDFLNGEALTYEEMRRRLTQHETTVPSPTENRP